MSLVDAISEPFSPARSPMAVSIPSGLSTYTRRAFDTDGEQQQLFSTLLRICTNAARADWRSQCRSNSTAIVYRRGLEQGIYRTGPYDQRPYHVTHGVPQRRNHAEESPHGLMDFLVRIADGLWERSKVSGSHAEELQAVHRMGNLYSWGNRVLGAARGQEFWSDDAVYAVVMAARYLNSWLLCEEGKREIDGLWQGR